MNIDDNQSVNPASGENIISSGNRDIAGLLVLLGLTIFLLSVTGIAQIFTWLFEQVLQYPGTAWPFWLWTLITFLHAALAIIPTFILAVIWPRAQIRIIFQALFAT